jgi:DNA (cytosine-5)-methyltransferase 1
MAAYYSEFNPYKAAWLRNLIDAGVIEAGEVDERDVATVQPGDLIGFSSVHLFAGVGGWSYALELAKWPSGREVWTASCPCTPHSSATRGRKTAPDLWPHVARLVAARAPRVLFGEQVAAAGDWFDRVCDDLEALDYEVGAAILPAVAVNYDHARPRIYFAGHAHGDRQPGGAVDAEVDRLPRHRSQRASVVLSDGVSSDLAQMRAFGDAIVPQVGQAFIEAYLESCEQAQKHELSGTRSRPPRAQRKELTPYFGTR